MRTRLIAALWWELFTRFLNLVVEDLQCLAPMLVLLDDQGRLLLHLSEVSVQFSDVALHRGLHRQRALHWHFAWSSISTSFKVILGA